MEHRAGPSLRPSWPSRRCRVQDWINGKDGQLKERKRVGWAYDGAERRRDYGRDVEEENGWCVPTVR